MINEPQFWGSWKSRIISSVVLYNVHDRNNIQKYSELSPDIFDKVLNELLELRVVTHDPTDDTYWITGNIYQKYRSFFNDMQIEVEKIEEKTSIAQMVEGDRKHNLRKWITDWSKVKAFPLFFENKHFFLYGRLLDDFSKDLICIANRNVVVVNPFVDSCNLSDTLNVARRKNVNVKLITRSPDNVNEKYPEEKQEYHQKLRELGVDIIYKKNIHGKLIVVDGEVAIVSSMNFQSSSSGGKTWEAGIVSLDPNVVNIVSKSIQYI
jgi:hypothetical protein